MMARSDVYNGEGYLGADMAEGLGEFESDITSTQDQEMFRDVIKEPGTPAMSIATHSPEHPCRNLQANLADTGAFVLFIVLTLTFLVTPEVR